MSSILPEAPQDLIDFHVGSPEPPNQPPVLDPPFPCETESLIDTDLPVFEQKLLTHSSTIYTQSRRNSVDVEDILIDFDDEAFERDSLDGEDVEFYNVCEGAVTDEEATLPVDNFEALLVLKNLDDILNATLDEPEADNNGNAGDDDTQFIIEECLEDLDNYLQAIESYESESEESFQQSTSEDNKESFNEELERCRLRQIEENYRKFVASGIVNRTFTDTENNSNLSLLGRPSSACAMPNRKQSLRANTVNGARRQRPKRRKSFSDHFLAPTRTSGTDAPVAAPEPGYNDVSRERHAYASADRCTGTVIVEPLYRQCEEASSSAYAVIDETVPSDPARTPWVRTSMRRLQQVALPLDLRPVSAPSRLLPAEPTNDRGRARFRSPDNRPRSASSSSRSRRARSPSSSATSVVSSVDSALSRMPPLSTSAPNRVEPPLTSNSPRRACEQQRDHEMPEAESPIGKWPHSLSSMMACLGCTLGLFNISRFAILTIHFGANFIFQFILLSLLFGLPLFTLQLCLGQQLGTGVIGMWKISPLFQGVGVSLLITQAFTGVYSIVGVSWMFVYFQDSFINAVDKYRWAQPFMYYRKDIQPPINGSYKLTETVPDYFNGVVLQRYHLPSGVAYGTIKFQSAFNLAVVWTVVFVSLSKGLRSYGKVIYVFTLLPVFGTFVLCAKILGLMPPEFINTIFPETSWGEFFLNSRSWLAAAQETFLTWGVLGAAIMQIASHIKHKHLMRRDSSLVAVITISVLLLVAFLANTCVQILKSYGYTYYPSSFERMSTYQFLRPTKDYVPNTVFNTPVRSMRHNSFLLGEQVSKPNSDGAHESGYQVLRLATEILPATFAVMGADQVSPFWAVLTYFILIMFGIAQQLAIWHCVITGIMGIKPKVLKKWDSTITFFSCACGFILGLPMATELGIYVVYFMDYTMGSIWWLVIVIILQIMAVFLVRGRPYSGDTVVTALFSPDNHSYLVSWAPPLLAFNWNVILPVGLTVLCIGTFKNNTFRDMFIWHHAPFADYWPLWARQAGSILQLLPLLCVPFVAVIQSYRYLNNGPPDILDDNEDSTINRIQLLYRPPLGEHMEDPPVVAAAINAQNPSTVLSEDPPPKYTPPPSYTTATGARLAKFLRHSIRRSMRRIVTAFGEGSPAPGTSRSRPSVQNLTQPPPPNYNAVFVEMNVSINTAEETGNSTLERLRNLQASHNALTAAEVASILRSSFRRSRLRSPASSPEHRENFAEHGVASLSAEHLVDAAAPIGETSLVLDHMQDQAGKAHTGDLSVI